MSEQEKNDLIESMIKKQYFNTKLRDPKRIETVLDLLKKAWESSPQLRLGQLIYAIANDPNADMFFVEDDKWEKLILKYLEDKNGI